MSEIKNITKKIIEFRDKRDWKKFHNPKDLAISLNLEASELLEHFQWKNENEINQYLKKNKTQVAEELADIMYWVLLISNDLKIDIMKSLEIKMNKNKKKYPIKKSKGNNKKYNQL
ncbi:MAG: nucleotide pyrophosphohydrolase [Alphaproteobacteria bacterium]